MQERMKNPSMLLPGAMESIQSLLKAASKGGVPQLTLELVHLRASQINGCSVCLDMHSRELKAAGEPDERIFMVGAWREAPYFSDAERAALGADRGCHAARRPLGSHPRRGVGGGRPSFRRGGVGLAAGDDRRDQRLQPAQRGDAPGGGVGAVAHLTPAGEIPNQPAKSVRASSW